MTAHVGYSSVEVENPATPVAPASLADGVDAMYWTTEPSAATLLL